MNINNNFNLKNNSEIEFFKNEKKDNLSKIKISQFKRGFFAAFIIGVFIDIWIILNGTFLPVFFMTIPFALLLSISTISKNFLNYQRKNSIISLTILFFTLALYIGIFILTLLTRGGDMLGFLLITALLPSMILGILFGIYITKIIRP